MILRFHFRDIARSSIRTRLNTSILQGNTKGLLIFGLDDYVKVLFANVFSSCSRRKIRVYNTACESALPQYVELQTKLRKGDNSYTLNSKNEDKERLVYWDFEFATLRALGI